MGWGSFKKKIKKNIGKVLLGPMGIAFDAAGGSDALDGFLGKDMRDQAAAYAATAQGQRDRALVLQNNALEQSNQRFAAESAHLAEDRERYNTMYRPIEEQLAADIAKGPALEEQAGIARSDFANSFDSSVAARNRQQMRQGVSFRPGSSSMRLQSDNDAYNRARGLAGASTQARREEDDRHFLRSEAFYRNNGSGIRDRLLSGMQNMYGAHQNATNTAAAQALANANMNQNYSTQLNANSYNGINSLINIGTRLGAAALTGGTSEAIGGISALGGTTSGGYSPINYNQLMKESEYNAGSTEADIIGGVNAYVDR